MTIEDLVQMVSRRLAHLSQLRTSASNLGDAVQVASLDDQIAETDATLAQLKALAP
jgi:hypothetical protein